MSAKAKTVLIGVSGGIAAYKAVACASELAKSGCDVHVAMSPGALEFIRPLTFAAVTRNPVIESVFPDATSAKNKELYPHIYPASEADLFVLAPASANMLAKLALGLAEDAVSASALALPSACKRIFCPSMHANMWAQASVQRNVQALAADGWLQVGPNEGQLACGGQGAGRMAEPQDIVAAVRAALNGD